MRARERPDRDLQPGPASAPEIRRPEPDVIACGAGIDTVVVDLLDTVGPDCEIVDFRL